MKLAVHVLIHAGNYARFAHVSRMFRDVSRCFARFADDSRIRDDSRCFAHVSRTFREIHARHYAHFANISRTFHGCDTL